MNTTLYVNPSPHLPVTGADLSAAQGKLVKNNGGTPAVNDSATVPAIGVVLEGNTAAEKSTIGILGAMPGQLFLKAGGAITKLSKLQQKSDGTVEVDAGEGPRVLIGVASEDAVAGELFAAVTHTPIIYAS